MWDITKLVFPYAIAYTIPLMITALGGLFSERGGIINIGLEGLMVVGFFASAVTITSLQIFLPDLSVWLGLLAGMIAGMLFSMLHAFASINLNANQVISGTAINMIAAAITVYLARTLTGSGNITIQSGLPRFDIPILSKIPFLGPLLFSNTYASTWLVLGILFLSWFILYKTSFGLRLRACGEHPYAAASAGINVYRMRYIAVMISGAFAGLGGSVILVTYSGEFNGSVAGLGFLALAALIFGQWKPFGVLGATFFFGSAVTIANISQVIPELGIIPPLLLKIFPYVITLVALIVFSKSSQAPKAEGEVFDLGRN
ncbi:MAG: ABC transporter permease [Clostridiales bacterium]|nr:ABC transporter permease [Clostridiales bacterium]